MVGAIGELRFIAFELMELQSMQVWAALRLSVACQINPRRDMFLGGGTKLWISSG